MPLCKESFISWALPLQYFSKIYIYTTYFLSILCNPAQILDFPVILWPSSFSCLWCASWCFSTNRGICKTMVQHSTMQYSWKKYTRGCARKNFLSFSVSCPEFQARTLPKCSHTPTEWMQYEFNSFELNEAGCTLLGTATRILHILLLKSVIAVIAPHDCNSAGLLCDRANFVNRLVLSLSRLDLSQTWWEIWRKWQRMKFETTMWLLFYYLTIKVGTFIRGLWCKSLFKYIITAMHGLCLHFRSGSLYTYIHIHCCCDGLKFICCRHSNIFNLIHF